MIRYPRPFRCRRQPVIPPALRPQTFTFKSTPGGDFPDLYRFLQVRPTWPSGERVKLQPLLSHLKEKGLLDSWTMEENPWARIATITVTRHVRLSPKLIANLPHRVRRLFA